MSFNYLDIVIALPFLWAIYRGWVKGFVLQLCTFIALIFGVWGAQELTDVIVPYLRTHYDVVTPYARVSVFAAVLLLLFIVVYLVGLLLTKIIKATMFSVPNRLAGVFFCILKYGVLVSFALFYLDKVNNQMNFMDPTLPDGSFFYKPLLKAAQWMYTNIVI